MLDGAGNVYVTGRTSSADFPTTAGAYDRSYNGDGDVFLAVLDTQVAPLDLSLSAKTASQVWVARGEPIAYTIELVNSGYLSTTFAVSDPIPLHTTYVPGSAWASTGAIIDTDGIAWSGTITESTQVSATFAVTASATLTQPVVVVNTATLTGDPGGPLALQAMVLVDPQQMFLPVVVRKTY
jgi:uncharacterized repeat protein (TIGR01451 family)